MYTVYVIFLKEVVLIMNNDYLEKEIELINRVITEAVCHGGDPGGAYCCNASELNSAILEWLKMRGIDNKYTTNYEATGEKYDIAIVKKTTPVY